MTPAEFRKLGHELIDWIADYRSRVETFPVMSQVTPGEIASKFSKTPPQKGESLETLTQDVEKKILPGITHWNHPHFYGYFPCNSTLTSILADLISTGFGSQGMNWVTSPAATELEEVTLDWLRQMVGLPETFTGVIQDTASTATLVALLCARERATEYCQTRGGLQNEQQPLVVYVSDQAHSSVDKAGLLAGFGRDNIRVIESDNAFAMRADKLEEAIVQDQREGRKPCAIVATIGTTATTAIDPLAQIALLAKEYHCWLHVDAALSGNAMIMPECRSMWTGVDHADSVVLNPHKWMGAAFDCSAYYVRDTEHLIRVMSTNPSYLQTSNDSKVKNFRDWGIPLGRRFRSLKLWLLIRDQGVEGLQARLRRDLQNAKWLEAQVRQTPDWEVIAPVVLQTVCIRHVPKRKTKDEINAHNLAWCDAINASGKALLTSTVVKGQRVVRVSIGVELTERAHVETLWKLIQETAAAQ